MSAPRQEWGAVAMLQSQRPCSYVLVSKTAYVNLLFGTKFSMSVTLLKTGGPRSLRTGGLVACELEVAVTPLLDMLV